MPKVNISWRCSGSIVNIANLLFRGDIRFVLRAFVFPQRRMRRSKHIELKYFPSYFLKMNLTHMLGRYVAYYLILQHIRCY